MELVAQFIGYGIGVVILLAVVLFILITIVTAILACISTVLVALGIDKPSGSVGSTPHYDWTEDGNFKRNLYKIVRKMGREGDD